MRPTAALVRIVSLVIGLSLGLAGAAAAVQNAPGPSAASETVVSAATQQVAAHRDGGRDKDKDRDKDKSKGKAKGEQRQDDDDDDDDDDDEDEDEDEEDDEDEGEDE